MKGVYGNLKQNFMLTKNKGSSLFTERIGYLANFCYSKLANLLAWFPLFAVPLDKKIRL